jgi:hypothetical protein
VIQNPCYSKPTDGTPAVPVDDLQPDPTASNPPSKRKSPRFAAALIEHFELVDNGLRHQEFLARLQDRMNEIWPSLKKDSQVP